MTKDEALKLALEKFEFMNHVDSIFADEFDFQINAIKEALAQPEQTTGNILMDSYKAMQSMKVEGPRHVVCQCDKCKAQPEQEPWSPVSIGVDVTKDGAHVVGIYAMSDETSQIFYAKHHPAPQRTWESIETAPKDGTDILLMYVHIDTQVVHSGFWLGASDTDDESDIGWWSYEHSEVSRIKLDDWMTPTYWLPLPKLKEKNEQTKDT